MRQGQNPKRSRGRNSGRRNVPARHTTFDSNGPSIRVRGNAHQVYEKYLAMARDAQAMGDRIMEENFHQHADHYFRLINSEPQEDRNAQQARRNGNGATNTAVSNRNVQSSQIDSEQPSQIDSEQSSQIDSEQPSQVESEQPSEVESEQPSEVESEQSSQGESEVVAKAPALDDDTEQATNN